LTSCVPGDGGIRRSGAARQLRRFVGGEKGFAAVHKEIRGLPGPIGNRVQQSLSARSAETSRGSGSWRESNDDGYQTLTPIVRGLLAFE